MRRLIILATLLLSFCTINAIERKVYNFNSDWKLCIGDFKGAENKVFNDNSWQNVTLPYAFNEKDAFSKAIIDHTDTICWYRKHFNISEIPGGKIFIEFEGARQAADVYINGKSVGYSENGVMAFGFDITPYLVKGENVIAVRCDNDWNYRSRDYDSRYQWNDRNFNANYGGLPKNVFLHVTGKVYQTLPLYSNLGTTGTYVYASDFDIPARKATINVEAQVKNDDNTTKKVSLLTKIYDADGKEVAKFNGESVTIEAGKQGVVKASKGLSNLHFWSWGYGYLYTVKTYLVEDGNKKPFDEVVTRTGFRKTKFGHGKVWLNDRAIMMHGYAQRTSNEWPGVGLSVPAWLSDYSNNLVVESNGNLIRWMHVTPWKQDVESCDRVGLIHAMPAGDAEKDVEGPRWQQRTALMRDAIIYNRNNPSILFYESGNESISREHMIEMKKIRDQYDPFGGRAIGSREMLDIDEAEYGGEMLYINKSDKHPMWATEYCRDEGLRKYWDEYSYPYHKEGDGPLYRGNPAPDYNHNMDNFTVELVRRWYDYWRERYGTATRTSAGGAKIVFSDTNTHQRGESNYRTSGVTDPMRIPKDAFYAHQVMWDGWVDTEKERTYIVGHWNYPENTVKPVYVVSTADEVKLLINGKEVKQKDKKEYHFLHTFDSVRFEAGKIEAIGYTNGKETSRYKIETAGEPHHLKLTKIENPEGMKADGADMALIEVEVLDKQNRRCPLDNSMINFNISGEGKWIGGIACRNNKDYMRPDVVKIKGLLDRTSTKNVSDNYVGAMSLPVECGVNRVLVRSTTNAGDIDISAYAEGIKPAYITLKTKAIETNSNAQITGTNEYLPKYTLKGVYSRGETPSTPSYKEEHVSVPIVSAKAGYDSENAKLSYDDNELSEWKNDGKLNSAWITYSLARKAKINDISIKLTGWRLRSYPLEIYADNKLVWSGETDRSLGYIHLTPQMKGSAKTFTIRLKGAGKDKDAFGGIVEVAAPTAGELDLFKTKDGGKTKNELRIVEIEFVE